MKIGLLIIIGIGIIGFSGISFATHDPTFNHPTPFGLSEPELPSCMSDREACQNPPICENSLWDCPDNSDIFSTVVESEDIGGGSINLDPDLSPSYALDFSMRLDSVFVAVPIMLGIISLLLISTHLILKKKKIPSRPYVSFIAAVILLFIGIPNLKAGLHVLNLLWQNDLFQKGDIVQSVIPTIVLGFVLTGIGIAILFKSKLTRNLIIYLRKRK